MTDQPRKSRFRLSLRALMLIVLVLAVILGWKANRARNQRRAVAAIKAINGQVFYDFQYDGDDVLTPKPMSPNKEPAGPKWLRKILGDEYFQEVTMIAFRSEVPAELLPVLATLDHLVVLSIDGSKLRDNDFAQIATIPRLQALTVSRGAVTDAGLAHLAQAKQLKRIAFHGASGVTDAGMVALAGMPDLKSLTVMGAPKLTAVGLKNLGPRLADLEILILYQTGLTDQGMDCLDACRKLKTISLQNARFGDSGFAHFRNMDALEKLIVSSTNITDQGLDSIRKLKGLKTVLLSGTKVSTEAVAALQAERPTLRIQFAPMAPVRVAPVSATPPAPK